MLLSSFNVTNFRNIESMQLDFDDSCNIFYGQNGSGKTSILESIYYLALGRSFRTHLLRRIIKYNTDCFSLFGKTQKNDHSISVGVERSITNGKRIKIAGEDVSSNIELTKLLPIQLLNQDSYRLFDDGPKMKRQFIDWGLFHVEQSFLALWRKADRTLHQRNAALRAKHPTQQVKAWDKELCDAGIELHKHRKQYIETIGPIAKTVVQKLLPDFSFDISYFAGWDSDISLEKALADSINNDLRLGYTTIGPHRADLRITTNKVPASDALSRGQQKLLLYSLQIAHGILLRESTQKRCIFLVDDLPAELDPQKRALLANTLVDLKTQLFITGLNNEELESIFDTKHKKVFHVEQGSIAK